MAEETHYRVHHGGRDNESRQRRGRSSGHRMVQKLGGGDVMVRYNRPAVVPREKLLAMLDELRREHSKGHCEVRTMDGQLVDLTTLGVVEESKVSAPLPEFVLDSAANDKTFEHGVGQEVPQFDGGLSEGASVEVPDLLQMDAEEGVVEEDDKPVDESGDPAAVRSKKRGKKDRG